MSVSSNASSSRFGRLSSQKEAIPMAPAAVHLDGESSSTSSASVSDSYAAMQKRDDMLAVFLGDRRAHSTTTTSLPSYTSQGDVESMGSYTKDASVKEPTTLARYMFIYGFLFPPLWLVGIVMLATPLNAPPSWADKSVEEQTRLLSEMRSVELKWGKRCLFALLTLLAIVALLAIVVWLAVRHH